MRFCNRFLIVTFVFFALSINSFSQWREFNSVTGVEKQPDAVVLTLKNGALRLQLCSDSIIRVTLSPTGSFPQQTDYVVIRQQWPKVVFNVNETEKDITISTTKLRVVVTRFSGIIEYFAGERKLLQDENRWLTPATVNGEQTYRSEGFFNIYGSPEGLYGLGQHQAGVWNYRGESVDLSQENANIAIPLLVSSNGYGIFWNNASRSKVNNRFPNYLYISSEVADTLDYYFIFGPEMDDIVAGYRDLTGGVPLFGKWAYGFWQCKNRYKTQDELLGVARKYRDLHIPIDNIVQDWFWWNRKGEHIFNSNYPDPKGMVEELHKNNLHLMISVWPFFEPGSQEYDYMDRQGWFIEKFKYDKLPYHRAGMAVYDATNPEARKYYWQLMNKALFSIGIDAWWLDTVEPETEGQEESILLGHKLGIGSGDRYANIYPLMTTSGVYQGQRSVTDDKRVFILARSAFAGSQRNAAAVWSGDILSDWASYKRQIPAGLNYALSGMPYWTTDIGGFVSGNPDDPAYRELFVRWFQYGAFSPIFRVHGTRTTNQNELWSYGPEAQKILVDYDRLRYRLLPYIYSTAWRVTTENYTPMRPLLMDFRSDANVLNIGDQFLFGPSILVAPVTEAGATSRRVYLPKTRWYDFWTGKTIDGGKSIEMSAPLQTMPLLIRAGSILTMGPEIEYAAQNPGGPLEIRVYAGADGDFTLYEDEGDSYRYEKGQHALVCMHWNDSTGTLTVGPRTGSFPGMVTQRELRIVLVSEKKGAGIAPTVKADKTIQYSGREVTVKLR
ncbi:MAG TPA: glycoside hydrolase family 31 protein [Terriglobales bacterium]|nr:glycoside hydrolase family 31 protein [Terriglobales bacterium]